VPRRALPRLFAYSIDWGLFAVWASLAGAAIWLLRDGATGWPQEGWRSQLWGAGITTVPFLAYLSLGEGSRRGATIGKRLLGLHVLGDDDQPPSRGRALLRNVVKLLPWELGHTAAHQMLAAGLADREPPQWAAWLSFASMALALGFVATLFVGDGRAPHDRVARTHVAGR